MATKVIMPALGMAQETGKLLAWLKQEGEAVIKGEVIMEIETDKAAVEFEAMASGILSGICAEPGQDIPVGEIVAWILEPGEEVPLVEPIQPRENKTETKSIPQTMPAGAGYNKNPQSSQAHLEISPVARNIAQEHGIDLNLIKPNGNRIQKADVLTFIERSGRNAYGAGIVLASPKARRLAAENGVALTMIAGSGPDGVVLAADVILYKSMPKTQTSSQSAILEGQPLEMSKAWSVMAERLAEAWRTIPHFYLERTINASQLVAWRKSAQNKTDTKITFTDLLIKTVARALKEHPRVNAAWINETILTNQEIHVGLAVATDDGLVVPVIPNTDMLAVDEIALQRQGIVERAVEGKLKLQDLQGGTFTISNLGMFGIDRFSAIVNPPQAAILAVGKIIEKAVPIDGEVEIIPTITLTLSCDHRVVDGARGAKFLDTLADYLEEPLRIL